MKNKIIKAIAIIILGTGILIPSFSIAQVAIAPTGNGTLISEETGAFSEIETEEETTDITTTKLQEKLTKEEILVTTITTTVKKETTTSSPALKSKEVTVTEMATEKTTIPTTEPKTEKEYIEPTVQATEPPATQAASTNSSYIGRMYITGYTAEEGFPEGSATASGYGVRSGYCALNNSQRQALGLHYGDKIYVEGLGTYTVMDCGCSWGVVDIWVYSNVEAYAMTGYYDVYIV